MCNNNNFIHIQLNVVQNNITSLRGDRVMFAYDNGCHCKEMDLRGKNERCGKAGFSLGITIYEKISGTSLCKQASNPPRETNSARFPMLLEHKKNLCKHSHS